VVRPQFEVKEFFEVPVGPPFPPKVSFVDNLIDLSPVMDDQNCSSTGPGVATDTVVNVVHTSSSSPCYSAADDNGGTTALTKRLSPCRRYRGTKKTHMTDKQSKLTDKQPTTANIVSPVVT